MRLGATNEIPHAIWQRSAMTAARCDKNMRNLERGALFSSKRGGGLEERRR
jgi:hypothetical protein